MYESFTALKIERSGNVLRVTLDNPPLNSMSAQMHNELSRLFFVINGDPETSVVVMTGAGEKAFSAGGNIKAMAERIEKQAHGDWVRGMHEARRIINGLLQLEKPLICRINGHAMGLGATLAVFADFAYMLESAQIADSHVKVGLSAGDGGALIWPMLVGFARARRYLMTGDPLTGSEAAAIGLITESARDLAELDEKVDSMARKLASGATLAISATKMSINGVLRKMLDGAIEAHLGFETLTYLSEDHYSAASAFRDKSVPQFKGE
jgi:enoyl-CoA hydratase